MNYYLSIIIFGEVVVLSQPTVHTSPGPVMTLVYIWEARITLRIITVVQQISFFIPSGPANELIWLIFKPTSRIMRILTHHLDPVMHNSGWIWITWVTRTSLYHNQLHANISPLSKSFESAHCCILFLSLLFHILELIASLNLLLLSFYQPQHSR